MRVPGELLAEFCKFSFGALDTDATGRMDSAVASLMFFARTRVALAFEVDYGIIMGMEVRGRLIVELAGMNWGWLLRIHVSQFASRRCVELVPRPASPA